MEYKKGLNNLNESSINAEDELGEKLAHQAALRKIAHIKGDKTMRCRIGDAQEEAYDAALYNMLNLLDAVQQDGVGRLKYIARVDTSLKIDPYMEVVFQELSEAMENDVKDPSVPLNVTLEHVRKAHGLWRKLAEASREVDLPKTSGAALLP